MADVIEIMDVEEQQEAGNEAPAAAAPLPQLPLNLLSTIKTAQAQNGLRHGDYMRYRKHCASKLQSLYKVLKMQHGRTKYVKRKLDVGNITDVRHLYVPLFSAERAWAYAMELKKEAEVGGAGGDVNRRKRHHLIERLAKAVVWANELARFAAVRSDTRGALEAEAYAAWMGANLLLEKESDWEVALAKFTRAKKLWQELAKVCPDLEGQSLCHAQVEEMEPNIRYCNYRIARAGGAVPADPAELLALSGEGGEGLSSLLQSKLAALAEEAQMAQAASSAHLEWPPGQRHPVRHERVKLALHQAAEFGAQIDKVMDADADAALEARLSLYDRAINALAEAKSHVRNAAKSLAGPDAESHFRELEALEGAVEGLRLQRTVERSDAHVAHSRARFQAGLGRLAAGKKIKDKERHARPEEVVRVLDLLARHLEDMADLGARMGGRQGEALHDAAQARASAARAMRTYYVAHALLSPASGSERDARPREAWALFGKAQERATAAAAALQAVPAGDAAAAVVLPPAAVAGLVGEMAAMKAEADAYKAVAQAEMLAADLRAKEEVSKGVGALSIEQQQQQQDASAQAPFLLEALDTWESFAGGAAAAGATGATGAKAPARLYRGPYPYAAVPVRPIMLDTASNCLSYPSLEHRLRKAEKKSVLSSLFSWRR